MAELKNTDNSERPLNYIDEYGFHGVTVNQIVAASNTSKGGFTIIFTRRMSFYLSFTTRLLHTY